MEPARAAEELLGVCRNCEAPLQGLFCSACGQKERGSARSMATLLAEARDAVVHIDGRLWSTLRALAFHPGRLTEEFFLERRARYVHPFRLYLVLSLIFFSLAALASGGLELSAKNIRLDGPGIGPAQPGAAQARTGKGVGAQPAGEEAGGPEQEARLAAEVNQACLNIQVAGSEPLRLALVEACQHHVADRGRNLARAVWANVPRMMFLFLPLMALVMKALYWRPRRFYVEHLVFFLHGHAAVYLFIGLAVAVGGLGRSLGLSWLPGVASFAVSWWLSWYLWRALRVFYRQNPLLTFAKLCLIGLAYLVFLCLTLLGTVIVSALSA